MSTVTDTVLGTHSEVGKLRTVMVHRPDLAHERLSPTNCHELLFDDVIWVRRARQEHDAFVDLMRERGVEVLLFHELLAQTLDDAEAREWLLSRRVRPEEVTAMFSEPLIDWLTEMPADELATKLTGGVTVAASCPTRSSAIGTALPPDRLRPAAAPEPALHARHERVDLRRRLAQPDVLARAPERDAERRGGLPLPPALPGRRLPDLVRRRRPRLGPGAARGRRHHAGRRRRRPRRHGRAQHRARGEHPRQEPVRGGRGAARDRRADAAGARGDAPRHRLHLLRPRRRHALRAGRRPRSSRSCSRRAARGRAGRGVRAPFLDEVQGRARARAS